MHLLGDMELPEILRRFREAFDAADVVTGHYIRGHGKRLKFVWERGNLLVSARSSGRLRGRGPSRRLRRVGPYFLFKAVHHPGNKRPVRFLTTPLYMYGRLAGFRVTTTAGA